MSTLDDINIMVIDTGAEEPDISNNVLAVLHEIQNLLDCLGRNGQCASIDLRSLPLNESEHHALKNFLGEDELSALLSAMGPTRIYETRFHGVWWLTHYNSNDELMAEFIEIATVPEILKAHPNDVKDAEERLNIELARLCEKDDKSE